MPEVSIPKSTEIYKAFVNGRVINRYSIKPDGSTLESPLFGEIYNNYNAYKQQYQMSGMELVVKDDFYYARDVDKETSFTDQVKRIQVLLLIIGRFVTQSGALFEKLTHPMGGITDDDLQKIANTAEFAEILAAIEIKDLVKSIKSNLLDKDIMEEPRSGRYILSAAGKHFFEEIFSGGLSDTTYQLNAAKLDDVNSQ